MDVLDLKETAVALALMLPAAAAHGVAAEPPTFQQRYAGGVTQLHVRVRVGRLVVEHTDGPELTIEVLLESRDRARVAACRASARLEHGVTSSRLSASISQRGRQQCGEQWLVRVPAGVALTLAVDVGDIIIKAAIPLPRAIDASANVGNVTVTASDDYRNLAARARVGRVRLDLDGAMIRPSTLGAAQSVEIDGRGVHDIRLTSGVGNVRATLTRTPARH